MNLPLDHLCTCRLISYRHLHRGEECLAACMLCRPKSPRIAQEIQGTKRPKPLKIQHGIPCGFCPETFRTLIERNAHRNQEHRTF